MIYGTFGSSLFSHLNTHSQFCVLSCLIEGHNVNFDSKPQCEIAHFEPCTYIRTYVRTYIHPSIIKVKVNLIIPKGQFLLQPAVNILFRRAIETSMNEFLNLFVVHLGIIYLRLHDSGL